MTVSLVRLERRSKPLRLPSITAKGSTDTELTHQRITMVGSAVLLRELASSTGMPLF